MTGKGIALLLLIGLPLSPAAKGQTGCEPRIVIGADVRSDGSALAATNVLLRLPAGLATDGAGSLYIAEYAGNKVRVVKPDGTIQTIAGTGGFGESGDGSLATSAGDVTIVLSPAESPAQEGASPPYAKVSVR